MIYNEVDLENSMLFYEAEAFHSEAGSKTTQRVIASYLEDHLVARV